MLVLDFMGKCRLKILDGISVESMECLKEDAQKKKKMTLSVHWGRDDLIATNAILLNIKQKFCGFSGDLIETIN